MSRPCVIRHDLSFRGPSPSSAVEIDDDNGRGNDEVAHDQLETAEGWDEVLLIDDDDVEMISWAA